MHTYVGTTPFGRRAMSLGMLADQAIAQSIDPGKSVDKWKLYRALCEARPRLGVTDRALAVMSALLSFHPKTELCEEDGLVVFPSNAQLSLRAHGMAEQTIRRHLAVLVEAGLLLRKDSANGKRYARRNRKGIIDDAFGFSLAPLLARSEEIEGLADDVIAERLQLQRKRERLTICCRDITKLIETAVQQGLRGSWEAFQLEAITLLRGMPRKMSAVQLEGALLEMELMRGRAVKELELCGKSQILSGNPHQSERHIQNSHTESQVEVEPLQKKDQAKNLPPVTPNPNSHINGFPLDMVLRACPQVEMYGPAGTIRNWRDLMTAAVVVRSMLGVSTNAYQTACETLGPENAAAVMACILERGEHITSAGGYLRDLTRRAELGRFSLGPMLMALLRAETAPKIKAG